MTASTLTHGNGRRSVLMKNALLCLVALSILAAPALAQSKIDQALAKAEEQLAKGKPEKAIKTMSKIVEQNPTSGEAQVALARLQERLGNLDEAIDQFQQALRLQPESAEAQRNLTTVLRQRR